MDECMGKETNRQTNKDIANSSTFLRPKVMKRPDCRDRPSILISVQFEQKAMSFFKHVKKHFTTLIDILEDFRVTFDLNPTVTC